MDLNSLDTEKINEITKEIDNMSTLEMVRMINEEDKEVAFAVEKQLEKISQAIDLIYFNMNQGGRMIYIGAGTSGRLGVLDASECPPTYGVDNQLIQGIIAGGKEAMFEAREGAEDSQELGILDLKQIGLTKNDVIVGIAASGRTPYVIGALQYANEIGAKTISISCVNNSKLSEHSTISIEVVVGAEVITGSTRMKAGTAQKMVLNMLSTGVMVKSGKVYGNLMIDLKPSNNKLLERAKRIISECTGCTREVAEEVFILSENNVKTAIFMILSNLDKENSEKILNENGGVMWKALKTLD